MDDPCGFFGDVYDANPRVMYPKSSARASLRLVFGIACVYAQTESKELNVVMVGILAMSM